MCLLFFEILLCRNDITVKVPHIRSAEAYKQGFAPFCYHTQAPVIGYRRIIAAPVYCAVIYICHSCPVLIGEQLFYFVGSKGEGGFSADCAQPCDISHFRKLGKKLFFLSVRGYPAAYKVIIKDICPVLLRLCICFGQDIDG